MALAPETSFPNSCKVIDRFHVVRLVLDAMQHIRVKLRWQAIDEENQEIKKAKELGKKYVPTFFENGDTLKELLARSKYLLYKNNTEWTINQTTRATLLFEKYPLLKSVYEMTLSFRGIYRNISKIRAHEQFMEWKEKIIALKIDEFNTVVNSLEYYLEDILNFFNYRSTNANAESFNSKIKNFRANLRGVTDVKFFLFRLQKLFAN
jgi:transposase